MGKNSKTKKAKKAAAASSSRGIVGPDYIQLLTGTLDSKSISLILCESHHDAIDVTRVGGGTVHEGWVETDCIELIGEMVGKMGGSTGNYCNDDNDNNACTFHRINCGMYKRNNKLLPLGKAKDWGREIGTAEMDYIQPGREIALLWVPSKENDGAKGRSYLLELSLEQERETASSSHLPSDVIDLLSDMSHVLKKMKGGFKSLSKVVHDIKSANENATNYYPKSLQYTLLQWTDTDNEARQLNHRRILGEDISTLEYDELINERKKKRREDENIWTWDDWLVEVKTKLANCSNNNSSDDDDDDAPVMHVVLESSIPPWEVELHKDVLTNFEHGQAADCIRCLPEDSDGSDIDAYDPSSDGFGSYIDYIYRRLLVMERDARDNDNNSDTHSIFLHCVDCRDLGCEHACIDDSLRKEWMDLLDPDEKDKLLGGTADTHKRKCLPATQATFLILAAGML
eukprot:scaffold56240_cov38-Cyclotella_meneghiniana.AAC.1